MRINEVEQLVDITKKNIRFYEEQGLLHPVRNEGNRYREYSEEDVVILKKIKLLRKLGIPIHEIRQVTENKILLEDCLERHLIALKRQEESLIKMKEVCREIMEERVSYSEMDVEHFLKRMNAMEKEGAIFMDTRTADKRSKKKGALLAAGSIVSCMLALIVLFAWCTWGLEKDPMPIALFVIFSVILLAIIIGILLSLRVRMKEIEKGEIYEATKY